MNKILLIIALALAGCSNPEPNPKLEPEISSTIVELEDKSYERAIKLSAQVDALEEELSNLFAKNLELAEQVSESERRVVLFEVTLSDHEKLLDKLRANGEKLLVYHSALANSKKEALKSIEEQKGRLSRPEIEIALVLKRIEDKRPLTRGELLRAESVHGELFGIDIRGGFRRLGTNIKTEMYLNKKARGNEHRPKVPHGFENKSED